jgi:TolB-like protein
MSLWTELKRRNVFRVAAAYVVIGWLMLQVADIVLGFTGAPDWVGKALIALLVLGFIPVLALAWVFEVGPEGVRVDNGTSQRDAGPQARRLDVITLGAVVLVVLLMIAQHLGPALLNPQPTGAEETVSVRPTEPPPAPAAQLPTEPIPEADPWIPAPGSIAALPFANRSAHAENKFFVDGIHDELLTELARNRALTVISRTSVMEYADTVKNLREIGTELGVANILEGAVQRSGDQVRITVQLIDAATDAHIWAETYDRQLTPENLFAVQTDIASEIAGTLGARIAPELAAARREAPTTNAEAYDLFLQARGQADLVDEPSIRARIALYNQALALDPEFAAAMGELGREHTNLYWYVTRRNEDRDTGGEWIERGLALQPENPRLRLARGEYFYRAFLDYEAALAELDRAANGLPGSAEIYSLRAFIKRRQGRPLEALDLLQEAALLDPRSSDILGSLVETYWLTGNLEQAERFQRSVDALSGTAMLRWQLTYQLALSRYRGQRPEVLETSPTEAPIERLVTLFGFDQFRWYLFFRDYALAERYLASLEGGPVSDQFEWQPVELMRASLAHARGQAAQALDQAAAALAEIDEELQQHPDDYRIHMARARALALLGPADPARRAIEIAMTRSVPQRDAMIETELTAQRFFILAQIADSEEVAQAVDSYLQRDMRFWDFDGLILDPAFDRHRDHPAFKALEAKYSRKVPKP